MIILQRELHIGDVKFMKGDFTARNIEKNDARFSVPVERATYE